MHAILNIPHASTEIPDRYKINMLLDKEALAKELELSTDWYSDKLFDQAPKYSCIKHEAKVSRLVCDTERLLVGEPMEEVGRGAVYVRDSFGNPFRNINAYYRQEIIDEYYIPYHQKLKSLVDDSLATYGSALIIDCHTFCDHSVLGADSNQKSNLQDVDICVGTSENTPRWLYPTLALSLLDSGLRVARNKPFSGTVVPLDYLGKPRVHSVMIEVNRRILNGNGLAKLQEFLAVWLVETLVQNEYNPPIYR